jgi:FKBP-type peptidyl-prolyl cis-trans isomerase 2
MTADESVLPTNDSGFFTGLEPGQRVRHPGRPDWGVGQIQSVVGSRVTVNFEHAGKVLINARVVNLSVID